MNRFVVNHELLGFEKVEIEDPRLMEDESLTILVVDESSNGQLYKYYNGVSNILNSRARLIMIVAGECVNIRKTLMMLMMNYRNYNIYRVESIEYANETYVKRIMERTPTLLEVQQFIGGDISAYSELNNILFGLKTAVNAGNVDGLKNFIENHLDSIESSTELIEYLRKIADSANSGELNSLIESLKSKLDEANKENTSLSNEIRTARNENVKLNEKISTLSNDITSANKKLAELKNAANTPGSVVTSYTTLQTSIIKCKAHHIIYFKEISYVRYTNSLVANLIKFLNETHQDEKIKLIIFDQKVGINGVYKSINTYNTKTYASNRQNIIKGNTKYVISEPGTSFIEDVVVSASPIFDTVIIYDRLGMQTPLIDGNNVTKIYVVNSATQYNNVKDTLKINNNNLVITSSPSIPNGFIIPEIEKYNSGTDSFRVSQYTKKSPVNWAGESMGMIDIILKKARID